MVTFSKGYIQTVALFFSLALFIWNLFIVTYNWPLNCHEDNRGALHCDLVLKNSNKYETDKRQGSTNKIACSYS